MTTDTDALKERIARALYENAEYYGPEDVQPAWEHRDDEEREEWREIAAAVLPIVEERERAAQERAWNEGGAHVEGRGGYYDPDDNPYPPAEH